MLKELPPIEEMEDWVLVALQELDGEAKFNLIDSKVKELLESAGVPTRETSRRIKNIRETSLNLKTSRCRTALEQNGLLSKPANGRWQLTASGETRANFKRQDLGLGEPKVRKPASPRVSSFAAEAIKRLENLRVSKAAIKSIQDLLCEFAMIDPEVGPSNKENREVEDKAIAFILCEEKDKGWQRHQNPNNPGFDLYQTDRRGRVICWCEVKGLSGKFSRVSLTKTEFEEARKRGERYWLYIVENATSKQPNLIRIKDPAGKAERFTYRHPAWRSVAEK